MIRFLHTSDLQLGMPFHQVPGDRGARLRNLRLAAIDRLGAVAREKDAQFIVVAGDLFDANTLDDEVVIQACQRFSRLALPIVVIPGNHDHCAGPGSIFRRRSFKKNKPDNLIVLDSKAPYPLLGGKAVILPAPLLQRHEVGDTTSHFTEDLGRDLAPDAIRVGLAHGGVIIFEMDWDEKPTNFIDPQRALKADLDYLALGDWHGLWEVNTHTWYSGAPEPTSFKDNKPGHVIVVEIEARRARPVIEPVPVACAHWVRHAETLNDEGDIARLARWFDALEKPEDTLVRLELAGSLSLAEMSALEDLRDRMQSVLLYLRLRGPGVIPRASDLELDGIATDGYVRLAIDRLRDQARSEGEGAEIAARALQLLHRLHATGESEC